MSSPNRLGIVKRLSRRFLSCTLDAYLVLNCGKALHKRSPDTFTKIYNPDHFFGITADNFLGCKTPDELNDKIKTQIALENEGDNTGLDVVLEVTD